MEANYNSNQYEGNGDVTEFDQAHSSSDSEFKVEMKSDPCMLCGHSPAVFYDCNGQPIRKEPLQSDYSLHHLFANLCHLMGIRRNCDLWRKWHFHKEPFPFCEGCESRLVTLTELRTKLDKVEEDLRNELFNSEEKFEEERLYEKHDHRYRTFRKVALGQFLNEDDKRLEERMSRIPFTIESEDDSAADCGFAGSPTQNTCERGRTKSKRLIEKSRARLASKRKVTKTKAEKITQSDDEMPEGSNLTASTAKEETGAGDMPSTNDSLVFKTNKLGKPKMVRRNRISPSARTRKSSTKLIKEQVRAKGRKRGTETLAQRERRLFQERHTNLLRLAKMRNSEMTPTDRSRFKYSIVRNPDTQEVTMIQGYRVGPNMKRVILKFTKEGEDKSANVITYRCSTCSEIVVQHAAPVAKQMKEFRAHHNRSHPLTESEKRSLGVVGYREPKVCHICGMPVARRAGIEYSLHQRTHMSEEEKQNFVSTQNRSLLARPPAEEDVHEEAMASMTSQSDASLCETCGQYVADGASGMRRHNYNHHRRSTESCLCPLCGETLKSKYILAAHMAKVHPDGKPTGPECKHPSCEGISFDTEISVREHVPAAHGDSEENRSGLLCLLCGRVFTSSWGTKMHKVVHTGEKSFKCDLCSKSFPLKDTLLYHLAAVHRQGESMGVFKCEVEACMETFPCRKYLGAHLRRVHGIYRRKQKEKGAQRHKRTKDERESS